MKISARTLAIEFARRLHPCWNDATHKEICEMAFFAGYKMAKQEMRKQSKSQPNTKANLGETK